MALLLATPAVAAPHTAVRELGQPDFSRYLPNRVDGRGLAAPTAVAVDRSRNPNGLWVLDTKNNRVLGWRDLGRAAAALPADVVLGQPDALSSGCNTGGLSARSLCFVVDSLYGFANRPYPGLAVDGEGNLWVADQANGRVLGYRRPFDTDAVADVVIGQADFDHTVPQGALGVSGGGLATDAAGNLFVVDWFRVVELDRPFATDATIDRVYGQSSVGAFDTFDDAEGLSPDTVAVDGAGRLYVSDVWSDRVLVWEQPLAVLGGAGPADHVLSQGGPHCPPYGCYNAKGIAVEPDGDLWVGDAALGKVFGYFEPFAAGSDSLPDVTIAAANVVPQYGQPSEWHIPEPGQPIEAGGRLAVDAAGELWIVDQHRVLGYSAPWAGQLVANRVVGQVRFDEVGINLVDGDGLASPAAIALDTSVSPPHVYVLDAANQRVLGWVDAEGFPNGQRANLVIGQPDRWSTGCNKGGRSLASLCPFSVYSGIAVDSRGTLWVADAGNDRVLGYRAPFREDTVADVVLGQRDGSTDGCGLTASGLCGPGGIAVDADDNLYVADILQNRILEYDAPLRHDRVADRVLGAAGMRRAGGADPAACFSYPNSTHPGIDVFGGLLAIDRDGRLLVGTWRYVYVFAKPRRALRSRRLIDLGDEVYYAPQAMATDSSGRIWITANGTVQRFLASGGGPDRELGVPCTFDHQTGLPLGFGADSLCRPYGIAVGLDDTLFVSDAFAHRVVVYEAP